jgi:hypothetical protein
MKAAVFHDYGTPPRHAEFPDRAPGSMAERLRVPHERLIDDAVAAAQTP